MQGRTKSTRAFGSITVKPMRQPAWDDMKAPMLPEAHGQRGQSNEPNDQREILRTVRSDSNMRTSWPVRRYDRLLRRRQAHSAPTSRDDGLARWRVQDSPRRLHGDVPHNRDITYRHGGSGRWLSWRLHRYAQRDLGRRRNCRFQAPERRTRRSLLAALDWSDHRKLSTSSRPPGSTDLIKPGLDHTRDWLPDSVQYHGTIHSCCFCPAQSVL